MEENEIQIEENQTEAEGYKPLFDDEKDFSEAELSGTDEEEPAGEEKETKPEDEEPTPEKVKEDESSESKNYVPEAALYEQRQERQKLAEEVSQLRQDLEEAKAAKSDTKLDDDFVVLTELEFEELVEDDPQEALRYQAKLLKHNDKKAAAEKKAQEQQKQAESIVYSTVERIEKSVPSIYDDDSPIAKELAEFAVKPGFKDEAFLEIMTNPATVVIPPGSNKLFLLSNGAASLIEMLHNLHKGREGTPSQEEATEAKISKGEPIDTREFSGEEWAKLSEEEQVKLLGG